MSGFVPQIARVGWCLALVLSAAAASAQAQAVANGTVDADARMRQLAQRLAQQEAPPASAHPSALTAPPAGSAEESSPLLSLPTAAPAQPNPSPAASLQQPVLDPVERTPLGPAATSGAAGGHSPDAWRDAGSWGLNTLAALGLVIALLLLLRWGWLRMGGVVRVGSSPVVEVLSRTAVAPRSGVLLLRVGSRILVVSDSPAGLRTLADIGEPEEVAQLLAAVTASRSNSITRGFGQLLERFHKDMDSASPSDEEGLDQQEHLIDRARSSVVGLRSRIRALTGREGAG